MSSKTKATYIYRVVPKRGAPFIITLPDGRDQWALSELIKAESRGCTPSDNPAPRWSAYKYNPVHEHEVPIVRLDETHCGKYAGTHGRYVLDCNVALIRVEGGAA